MNPVFDEINDALLSRIRDRKALITIPPKAGKGKLEKEKINSFSEGYVEAMNDVITLFGESPIELSEDAVKAEWLLIGDSDTIESTLSCGCKVTVDLEEASEANTKKNLPSHEVALDTDDCDEHGANDTLREFAQKYARELWLKDPCVRFSTEYAELFKELGDDF